MKITIFGSASGIPEKGRVHTCIGVEVKEKMILLDIGEGAVSSIAGDGINVDKIEKVFISHMHADHFIGLPMLLQYLKLKERKKSLEIYLPEKHIEAVEKFLPFLYIFRERFEFEYKFLPLPAKEFFVFDNLKMKMLPTKHLQKYEKYANLYGVETTSYSYLIEEIASDGVDVKRFLFSSDLNSADEIKPYLDGLDLLLIECSHIEIEEIIDTLSDFYIPKIVLTHVSPDKDIRPMVEYARAKFDMNIDLAYDGMKIEV
ncbi:MAG: MBL fold metallo-hydrolase [Candidatus Kryptonium sp.]|nr:MBL fold metallo-hydrolase [Candidatus Kryptonium sp.]MCX7762065.1 MBL fold metallo-hydrolase [Candidatus Kryptonium sp.]